MKAIEKNNKVIMISSLKKFADEVIEFPKKVFRLLILRMEKFLILTCVTFFNVIIKMLMHSERTLDLLFIPGLEKFRWKLGQLRVWHEFEKARKRVPAYSKFLNANADWNLLLKRRYAKLDLIPSMDKNNYIKQFDFTSRCLDGKFPTKGIIIDESSGSSGIPTNWIRGKEERKYNTKMLQFSFRKLIGNDPVFIINAFALGSWATGINVTFSFLNISVIKSPGPDISKIENTLKLFGKEHNYVIMGYPPFLKTLVDSVDLKWKDYKINFLNGGEGMSESMRKYFISKGIRKVYSSFGASDLELNMAGENNFTIGLRNLLIENRELAKKVLKQDSFPMVFQYNPSDFFIEENSSGEILISICRPGYISPKIRYNIHDKGHVLRIPELKKILSDSGIDIKELGGGPSSDLPILFHYGRTDLSVSFYGCKILPSDVQDAIFKTSMLAEIANSFRLMTYEDEKLNKKLVISIEILKENLIPDQGIQAAITRDFFENLSDLNQDFRESIKMAKLLSEPEIKYYRPGDGPFKNCDIRIKRNYL